METSANGMTTPGRHPDRLKLDAEGFGPVAIAGSTGLSRRTIVGVLEDPERKEEAGVLGIEGKEPLGTGGGGTIVNG